MSGRLLVHERPVIVRAQPVAVVTGASRNIGSAIASRLQDDGYQIVATVFEGEPPSNGTPATVSKLEADEIARKNDWDVVLLDLADPSASEELVSFVRERYGRLDCLVNNAATWTYGPALSISDERWRNVLDVNVLALVRLVRESHPLLREAPAARIVNLSSIGAEWSGNRGRPLLRLQGGGERTHPSSFGRARRRRYCCQRRRAGLHRSVVELSGTGRSRRTGTAPVAHPGGPPRQAHRSGRCRVLSGVADPWVRDREHLKDRWRAVGKARSTVHE